MSLFSKKKKNGTLGLVFDIGSGSIGAAIIYFHEERPKIIYSKRIPFKTTREISAESLVSRMKGTFVEILADLEKEGLKHLNFTKYKKKSFERINIFFSSPWFISSTQTIIKKEKEPFEITKSLVNSEILKEEKTYEKSEEAKVSFENRGSVIERKIIGVKLNGYKTNSPYGKEASELELSVFMSQADIEILSFLENAVLKSFTYENIEFNSFSLASFSAVRDIYGKMENFTLIDVTSEVTDIVIVRESSIEESLSFPKGKNFVSRKIAEAFDAVLPNALSLWRMYENDESRRGEVGKMVKILDEAREEWLSSLGELLSSSGRGLSMSRNIFMTADADTAGWFLKALSEENFAEQVMADGRFDIKLLSNEAALNERLIKNKNNPNDAFLSIDALFANKIFELESDS